MKIGCFACVEPFAPLARQLKAIQEMGFTFADVTDNHDGGALGEEFGFAPTVSLDSHPSHLRALAKDAGIRLSAFCAHANLLDPSSPATYGTAQIVKAVRLASDLGIREVITCDGEPHTAFGKSLKPKERVLIACEKLQFPVQWAEELGVRLLIETHGPVTDNLTLMGDLLERLGHEKTVGICLDTGNCWLGGGDPLAYIKTFGKRIGHVHWKDMPTEMEKQRGKIFGCGMALIAAGDGVVGIEGIVKALKAAKIDVPTTLEIAGAEAVMLSAKRLKQWERRVDA
ncbi:MAG: sugar phosphate isomerase/epimerase [Kiritimatiellaeota bacterium]|nr:sugar phosphate isomerase/epimerase [Kiritimatiellota bacterium]